MRPSWTKDQGSGNHDKEMYVKLIKDETFHVGQMYVEVPCETYVCLGCGGKEFKVGYGDLFTAIKCVKCLWEVEVHEG